MPQQFSRLARLISTLAGLTVLAACGGGGGGGNTPPGGGGPTVTVSGKITYDRLAFSTTAGGGLDPNTPIESPARQVTVQARSGSTTVATTTTDANGDYSFTVPANTDIFIRARAEMIKSGSAPIWTFAVRDNTAGDAIYAIDGATFNTGTANVTRNLRAPSDWNGSSYNAGRRAAPFAILDTVYQTKQLILGANPSAQFPPLDLFWSEDNKSTLPFCPDNGNIGTSFYARGQRDDCTNQAPLPDGIYVLGFFANNDTGDTDEYDAHVIAHEFGHYFEDRFSRSDSLGGQHSLSDRLDLRVAFGEGWGNAFGAMALNDPQYRDSVRGVSQDSGFNLESGPVTNPGWFSEASVGQFLWDVFDTTADVGDNVELGFTPIYNVMTDQQVDTPALTSIYSFADALRADNGGESADIQTLLQRQEVRGTGAFGTNETNAGNDPGFTAVYADITPAQQVIVCSTNGNTDGNKLGNRRLLRFVKGGGGAVTIQATGVTVPSVAGSAPAVDPDILVLQQGVLRSLDQGQSTVTNQETISSLPLAAGTYVLEVYAYETIDPDQTRLVTTPRCMSVTIQEL